MTSSRRGVLVRVETWWWTGPLGHFVAGVADWFQALTGWLLVRARERVRARLRARARS